MSTIISNCRNHQRPNMIQAARMEEKNNKDAWMRVRSQQRPPSQHGADCTSQLGEEITCRRNV